MTRHVNSINSSQWNQNDLQLWGSMPTIPSIIPSTIKHVCSLIKCICSLFIARQNAECTCDQMEHGPFGILLTLSWNHHRSFTVATTTPWQADLSTPFPISLVWPKFVFSMLKFPPWCKPAHFTSPPWVSPDPFPLRGHPHYQSRL